MINPLKSGLRSWTGRVCVLIGAGTFSAALDNAIAMRKELKAVLIGEPTAERPNGYGEVRLLKLPNSGLTMQYSTKYFHMVTGNPLALEPDQLVAHRLADDLAGRDPVLEAALNR